MVGMAELSEQMRRRIEEIFGDALPVTTSDERGAVEPRREAGPVVLHHHQFFLEIAARAFGSNPAFAGSFQVGQGGFEALHGGV